LYQTHRVQHVGLIHDIVPQAAWFALMIKDRADLESRKNAPEQVM
jgi:hypothetical protein